MATLMGYQTVGDFIRDRRRALGMSQAQLAELVDRDQTYVSQMELNATDGYLPPRDMLAKLATALACTREELLRAAGYLNDEEEVEATDNVAIYTAMMRDTDRLNAPPELKAHIRQTIEFARRLADQH